ncbi:tetratricopeptide repeat protein [Olivibacter sitiensis]|uniref:ATP-binding protein n=1 Tax=Olivibacter sitiensis TaxID=376470 RepID=UPI000480EBCD|nr:tetratricopeptide repeat protein [Olivibacter sitiensis]
MSNLYYDRAFDYLDQGKVDSSFFYFDKAKDVFIELRDSLNAANCLIQMAITQTDNSDYFGGIETSIQAKTYLSEHNTEHRTYLKANLNNLGIASFRLGQYEKAIEFYDSAIQFSDDSLDTRIYLNNKARAYQQNGNYDKALAIYRLILRKGSKNQREYARALTNVAAAQWRQKTTFDPRRDLLKALNIRKNENDLWGQNSSYAHLADYYAEKQTDSALFYARQWYEMGQKLNSADDQIGALQFLIKLSPPDSVKSYFDTYQQLSDSVQLARSAAKNQFALIRYEVEKNKADNLRLQNEVNKQRIRVTMVIALTLLASVSGFYWYKRRKQRLEVEAQNRIKEHKLKTSKKVHDVVANGLYQVMSEIEYKEDINREDILDRLEYMYEKSRDISYEQEGLPSDQPDFGQKIAKLLYSFQSHSREIVPAGNDCQVWGHVPEQTQSEIEHILRELMVNMRKHSRASLVVVKFEQRDGHLYIHYSDNGVGLSETFRYGNGLRNTGNRIESLGGHITFDSEEGKGLKIQISFPLS